MGIVGISNLNSLQRFITVADQLKEVESLPSAQKIHYAFDILERVALDFNAWQIVFDPASLKVYFRTNQNPEIRRVDFDNLDFSCQTPVKMLDVHAPGSGDVSGEFELYNHKASLAHTVNFMEEYERLDYPTVLLEVLLRGLEGFPCMEEEVEEGSISHLFQEDYDPLLPMRVTWAARALVLNIWPYWVALTLLGLVYVIWRVMWNEPKSPAKRLIWILVLLILGPIGLLIFILVDRKRFRLRSGMP
jgi:hypothetical protein